MSAEDDFGAFVDARSGSLYRLAYLLCGSSADAEDLLQEALVRAYDRWPRLSRLDAPEAYVRRILTSLFLSGRRRPFRRHEVPLVSVAEPRDAVPGRTVEQVVTARDLLWPLVCALPPRQRAVVVLRYYEDLTDLQIAEALGCSRGSVTSQAHDAVAALGRGLAALHARDERVVEP
jgi:RNA polymerase sigma-70 factor (sigma-E family)